MGCGASQDAMVSEPDGEGSPPKPSSAKSTRSTRSRSLLPLQRRGTALTFRDPRRNSTAHGLPPPSPPIDLKEDFVDLELLAEVDQHALSVPDEYLYGSFENLAKYLTLDMECDLERVRSIFTWLANIALMDIRHKYTELPEPHTPLDYLLKISFDMGNHAYLFAQLCRAAKVPCFLVTGINKSAAYKVGAPIERSRLQAQWNAVLIDGQWRLVDVFWASTCVVRRKQSDWALMTVDGEIVEEDEEPEDETPEHYVNEFFFLPDPEHLIWTHLPDRDIWQLMEEPFTLEDFETSVYVRERFFQLGIAFNEYRSHRECVIDAENGIKEIYFDLPPSRVPNMQFRYILFKEKNTEEDDTMLKELSDYPLERYVFYQKLSSGLLYTARFPMKGRFKLDIFGQDTKCHDALDLAASYIIICNETNASCQPLPDNPDIGWGPGADAAEVGLRAKTHEEGVILTEDGNVEIKFDMDNPVSVLQDLKHNELDELLLSRHAVVDCTDGEMTVDIRLPQAGEFALNLFADKEGAEGDVPNVCNYLIRCDNPEIETKPFPKVHDGILGKGAYSDKLDVVAVNHTGGKITADENGKLEAEFEAPENIELYAEVHRDPEGTKVLSKNVTKTEDGEGKVKFEVDFDDSGEYGLNIFAKKKDSEENQLYHVHTYLVDVPHGKNGDQDGTGEGDDDQTKRALLGDDDDDSTKKADSLSTVGVREGDVSTSHITGIDVPDSRRGQRGGDGDKPPGTAGSLNDDIRGMGLSGIERLGREMNIMTLSTTNDYIDITLPYHERPLVAELSRKNAQDPIMKDQLKWTVKADAEVVTAQLPEIGLYKMDLYETTEKGALIHVNTYNLWRCEDEEDQYGYTPGKDKRKRHPKYLDGEDGAEDADGGGISTEEEDAIERAAQLKVAEEEAARQQQLTEEERILAEAEKLAQGQKLEEERKAKEELELQYRALRKQLRLAIASGNPEYLGIAIKEFTENNVPDPNGDIPKAMKLKEFWEVREARMLAELTQAMSHRQLKSIERALAHAEKAGVVDQLGLQVAMARRIAEHLQGIEVIRHAILKMDQRTIAEIKSYSCPPEAVHHVMVATYLLLGEPEENLKVRLDSRACAESAERPLVFRDLLSQYERWLLKATVHPCFPQDWDSVINVLRRTGKRSLKRMVSDFNVDSISMETALQAYLIVKKFTVDDVKDVSVGVATFFVWARKMIEEKESRYTQAGGDIKQIAVRPVKILRPPRPKSGIIKTRTPTPASAKRPPYM